MASRGSSFEIPKPESGIADWASKIREMQRQVDADEDAEQKRLEEEIAASRLKRLSRRSHLAGSRSTSLDLSRHKEFASVLEKDNDPSSNDEAKSLAERQDAQADALKRLNGGSRSPISGLPEKPSSSALSQKSRAEPVSLAAFIGGRATGPRLNKHTPQQDAHDPTQFDQRSTNTIKNAPHPIFGRSGVGLPGMTPSVAKSSSVDATVSTSTRSPEAHLASSTSSTSPPLAASQAFSSSHKSAISEELAAPKASERQVSPSPLIPRTITPTSRTPDPKAPSEPKSPTARASTPKRSYSSSATSPSSPSRKITPVSTPSLARPVLPQTKASPQGPQVSVSNSVSPAFQRTAATKELTPSLSRLQGRGFVQNMVKASVQSGGGEGPVVAAPRPVSGGRKPSVLDRWQPNATISPNPAELPSPVSPKPLRKSWTVDSTSSPVGITETKPEPKAFKPVLPKPSSNGPHAAPGPSAKEQLPPPGIGSKTTFMVVRPAQSASQPQNDQSASTQVPPAVDEFGAKPSRETALPTSQPPPGKPLVHLTRDRAKKPPKGKQRSSQAEPRPTETEKAALAPVEEQEAPPARTPSPLAVKDSPPSSGRIMDRWGEQAVIGIKQQVSVPVAQPAPKSHGMAGKVALPGLVPPQQASTPSRSLSTSPVDQRTSPAFSAQQPPSLGMGPPPRERSPGVSKHTRIPSTGNRATVMDVAQVMHERAESTSPLISPLSPKPAPEWEPEPELAQELPAAVPRPRNIVPPSPEKRRSSYDRYSSLPPLQEETTPVASPAGTLSRSAAKGVIVDLPQSLTAGDGSETKSNADEDKLIPEELMNEPLPPYNVGQLLSALPASKQPDADTNTISVDVMSIAGNTSSAITKDTNVFYDSEVLAIIRRFKSKSSGLVGTTVWAWLGKQAEHSDREDRKLQELAKRYGTSVIYVPQGAEPLNLLSYLDQALSIRQGTRAHWSSENTAMHSVREVAPGVVVIDEHDLHVKNLCSGYSFCLSILNTQYVWHGRGSRPAEQAAALKFAQNLAGELAAVVELHEGQSDEDEMFWMMLGDEPFAAADYWRWRPSVDSRPRIFSVDPSEAARPISLVDAASWKWSSSEVLILDCVWEFFVILGEDARLNRRAVRLGIAAATELSSRVAKLRPFSPPVHVLALPSKLPLDLRLMFRGLDEAYLNNGQVPEHMNVLNSGDALSLLAKVSWQATNWAISTKAFT